MKNIQLRPYQSELLDGVHASWASGHKSPCVVLPCGGGKSCIVAEMARRTTCRGKRVLFLVHRRELCEQIVRTFTAWGVDMNRCTVGMVQTLTRRIDDMEAPTLIITDENHHAPAASYKRIYEAFPDAYRVGVTATPTRLGGGGLGDVNDDLVIGVNAKWLIANGFLSPYDYFAPTVVDLTGIRTNHGEYSASQLEERMMKGTIHGDAVRHYIKLAMGKKAVCYCVSVRHSRAVAEAFRSAGIPAEHIDGDTPDAERAEIVERFRSGDVRILCNVDLVSEGFDVPDCECAILLRPTKSLTIYIQQSMRCMRYLQGKRAVIIDHVGNYARFGLPDADREWTLEGKAKKHAKSEQNTVDIITCPMCFRAFEPREKKDGCCPWCGEIILGKERIVEEKPETILEKVDGFVLRYDSPADCKSFAELAALGKRRGYKPGWAWHQAKSRGFIH